MTNVHNEHVQLKFEKVLLQSSILVPFACLTSFSREGRGSLTLRRILSRILKRFGTGKKRGSVVHNQMSLPK